MNTGLLEEGDGILLEVEEQVPRTAREDGGEDVGKGCTSIGGSQPPRRVVCQAVGNLWRIKDYQHAKNGGNNQQAAIPLSAFK